MAPKRTLMREDLSIINSRFYGAARTAGTLNAALAGIGADKRTLMLCDEDDGIWTLATDVTVPANVTLLIPAGVTIVGAGNLTINGYFTAYRDDWYQGTGVVTTNYAFYVTRPVHQTIGSIMAIPGGSVETTLLTLTITARAGDFIQFIANAVAEIVANATFRIRKTNATTGPQLGATQIKGDGTGDWSTAVIHVIENVTVTGPQTYYFTIVSTTAINVSLGHFTGVHYRATGI